MGVTVVGRDWRLNGEGVCAWSCGPWMLYRVPLRTQHPLGDRRRDAYMQAEGQTERSRDTHTHTRTHTPTHPHIPKPQIPYLGDQGLQELEHDVCGCSDGNGLGAHQPLAVCRVVRRQ
eukprot:51476-Eustigmatos_ZCMA.PRE.1